ncbi:acyl-CoA dehydrogenase family protein [Dactylosporangium sp. CS-033363]|uniref:acyl-CoA dehydrogenase family protein n=1 Tax=Dactylosporangium sp. CS-033363 TaxID=3239935 RepID=UPI003D8FD340
MSPLSVAEREAWRASVAAVVQRGASWEALADLGVTETGFEDLGVAIEECGAVAVATPLLGHMFGLLALRAAPLPGRLALVLPEGYALDGGAADWFAIVDGSRLSVVPADRVARRPLSTLDPTRVLWRVEFDESAVTHVGECDGERLRAELAALVAADSIGGARAVLRDAVAYAQQRLQFGRPIGSFQAVKHRLADLSSRLDGAVASVGYALRRLDLDAPDASLAASVAKLAATEAYLAAAEGAIQTYGGIGFTWEHPAHVFLKRAHTNSQLAGGAASHLELVAGRAGI